MIMKNILFVNYLLRTDLKTSIEFLNNRVKKLNIDD